MIINNVKFDKYNKGQPEHKKLPERGGSNEDVRRIKETFSGLGWTVEEKYILQDQKEAKIKKKIESIQKLKDLSCLALFIMSHGSDNDTIYADDGTYNLNKDIIENLTADKCPFLAGKPKLFFIQACQGGQADSGFSVQHKICDSSDNNGTEGNRHNRFKTVKIPNPADMFVFKASYTGFRCYRNDNGSWFMESLCKVITDNPKMDLGSIALKVTNSVSKRESHSWTDDDDQKKQVPMTISTLLLKMYFIEDIDQSSPTCAISEASTTGRNQNPPIEVNRSPIESEPGAQLEATLLSNQITHSEEDDEEAISSQFERNSATNSVRRSMQKLKKVFFKS